MRRTLALLSLSVVALVLAPGAWAQAAGPTCRARRSSRPWASRSNTFTFSTDCDNPDGTATASIHATGVATGPYPGTFEETVDVTLGAPDAGGVRPLLSAVASFRIDSGTTVVTGQKALDLGVAGQVRTCARSIERPDASRPGETCRQTNFRVDPRFRYSATIAAATGTTSDSGRAAASIFTAETRGCTDIGDNDQGQFNEVFVLSDQLASTPGKAAGAGRLLGQPVSFAFFARADRNGATQGTCLVFDDATDTLVRCLDVTTYVQVGNRAVFTGRARVNGDGDDLPDRGRGQRRAGSGPRHVHDLDRQRLLRDGRARARQHPGLRGAGLARSDGPRSGGP